MPTRAAAALLTLLVTAALAACGGSDGGDKTSSTSASSASGDSRATQSAKEILADVTADIAKVRSYHLEGTQTDAQDGRVTLKADVSADSKVRGTLGNKGKTADFVVVGGMSYLRANAAFWKEQGGAQGTKLAQVLAGKWVRSPEGADRFLRGLLPKDLGYCLQRSGADPTNSGTRTDAGQEVVVLTAKGDKPGTAPGQLFVPSQGKALPTRFTQTGREKRGTPDPRCDDDSGDTTIEADIRLSDYDKPVTITAPKGALTPQDLLRNGAAGEQQTS